MSSSEIHFSWLRHIFHVSVRGGVKRAVIVTLTHMVNGILHLKCFKSLSSMEDMPPHSGDVQSRTFNGNLPGCQASKYLEAFKNGRQGIFCCLNLCCRVPQKGLHFNQIDVHLLGTYSQASNDANAARTRMFLMHQDLFFCVANT